MEYLEKAIDLLSTMQLHDLSYRHPHAHQHYEHQSMSQVPQNPQCQVVVLKQYKHWLFDLVDVLIPNLKQPIVLHPLHHIKRILLGVRSRCIY